MIIDRDYVLGDTEGEIFFQLINLTPWDIQLKRGDRIGQGIIKQYLTTEDDNCTGKQRTGGLGSTSEEQEALELAATAILHDSEEVGKALKAFHDSAFAEGKDVHKLNIYLEDDIDE